MKTQVRYATKIPAILALLTLGAATACSADTGKSNGQASPKVTDTANPSGGAASSNSSEPKDTTSTAGANAAPSSPIPSPAPVPEPDAGADVDAGSDGGTTRECAAAGRSCTEVGCCEHLTCDGESSTCVFKIVPADPNKICGLPLDPGPCKALFTAYGFNTKSNRCEEFTYGGCSGNENRFETLEACSKVCEARAVPF